MATSRYTLTLTVAAVLALAGCGSGPQEYDILITEPSGGITKGSIMGVNGKLDVHWSCDPTVDPATRYLGTQDGLWTSVDGVKGEAVLRTQAACPDGAVLTVQADAAVASTDYRATRLRCEVFDADGDRVADETVTRGMGTTDPICRVVVKG